uniref:Translational activator GCN1 n=1 Tax=Aceria tosichella TaxID=561515 RepID=A0A6G1S5U8_9ACAR
MNKLNLDEEAIAFLEDVCQLTPENKLDANLYIKILDNNILKRTYQDDSCRDAVARACAALLVKYNDKANEFFDKIIEMYQVAYQKSEPKIDDLGRKKINPLKDSYSDQRLTLAQILVKCVPHATTKSVNKLIPFFVPTAISDRNTRVQETMLEAALALINEHGSKRTQYIMSTFQTFLTKSSKTSENDNTRRNVIILLGTMAKHLDPNDAQVKTILAHLIQALETPSQVVQEAVANCFPPLIEAYRKESAAMLKEFNKALYDGTDYGKRKGSAYGIYGIVRGLGMTAIKQQVGFMKKAIQDSKTNKKLGGLIGIEVFTSMLGRLFEPFIGQLLPHLLVCYSDPTTAVREATEETSRILMRYMSATGVRLTLPVLLKSIDQDAWRTKVGSVQLLASMANCAPKQLSLCLPTIVPKVIEVLSDSHMKVQEAASQALRQLCQAIRNPEISSLSKHIMAALQDPAKETHGCLVAITKLEFKHFIDAASLSLIMPIVQRGFKERSSETRKLAAQIIGALYLLTNQRDLSPYLAAVIPGIKTSILDPVPEVRAVTASALGAMVRGSGEDVIVELMPWLLEKLTCNTSQVDRSGAAQAIAEVVGALGLTKLDSFMEEIIMTIDDPRLEPHVKDGYLMLFIYFPIIMQDDFSPYIDLIISPVLNGLADDVEYVRETALLAGQRIVNMYADSAVKLLLPELEKGLLDDNWRIRLSSVKLIGDLLYKVSGIVSKAYSDVAGEDEISDGKPEEAIKAALGVETSDRVLAGIYMCRSDLSHEVKHASLHIWKMVIGNTAKTLRELLPTLFNILLGCLASKTEEKQQMAARALSDLVKKLGERLLSDLVPILDEGLRSNRSDQRQGVCIGLSEVISSTSKDMISTFVPPFIPLVRRALHDSLPEVRESAARTFDSLHQALGNKALDEVLPYLIKQLDDSSYGEATLDGIKQMMVTKNRIILPYILPHLTDHQPVNTRALAMLAPVAGEALTRHLARILPAMLLTLSKKLDTKDEKRESANCNNVVLAACDNDGTQFVLDHLVQATKHSDRSIRRSSVILLNGMCHHASLAPTHISQVLHALIVLYAEDNQKILDLVWDGINCLTMNMDSGDCIEYISDVRNAIRYAISDLKAAKKIYSSNKLKADDNSDELALPGLMSAHGFAPLSVVYRETIINGPPDRKELAASSLCEIITYSSSNAVKASTMKMAGAVIRILSECIIKDRHTTSVKLGLLDTLILLMKRVGSKMRPFIPQCELTLRKLLQDPQNEVRLRAVDALSELIVISDTWPHARSKAIEAELNKVRASMQA